MKEPLPEDVVERVKEEYKERADEVLSLLLARREIGSGDFFGDRLIRCVVFAAKGNISRVPELIELGTQDERDLIHAGEYEGMKRGEYRNFNLPFHEDGDLNYWIAWVKALMAARGYRLATLESRPATVRHSEYPSDDGEGRAAFVGPNGTVQIELKDLQWRVCGDRPTLELHGLNRKFESARAFEDALVALLLSRYPLPEPGNWEEQPVEEPPPPRPWWKFWG